MTVLNPVYRYLHELAYGRKRNKTEELYAIAHDLLTAARDAAVTCRNASVTVGAIAEKENSLSKFRLAEQLTENAVALEAAVNGAGGYNSYLDTPPRVEV